MYQDSFKRKRKIRPNELSLTGNFSSYKNHNIVEFESSLENDFIHILEFDKRVKSYYEQPIRIYYNENGIQKYYVPDFLVVHNNGEKVIYEVKYLKDIEDNYNLYVTKFEAANAFCKMNAIRFQVVSEDFIRGPIGWNSKFLNKYKRPIYNTNFEEVYLIEKKMLKIKESSPIELIESLVKDEFKKAELLYYLWHSIANYCIEFDISKKLNMRSKIWYNIK